MSKVIYYEMHVTLDNHGVTWDEIEERFRGSAWRASFFRNDDSADVAPREVILTAKSRNLRRLKKARANLLPVLRGLTPAIAVTREKIEAAILDTKPLSQHRGLL